MSVLVSDQLVEEELHVENDMKEELKLPIYVNMKPLLIVSPSETVANLVYEMIEKDVEAALVFDEGEPVGIITDRDVLEKVTRLKKSLHETNAGEIMSKLSFVIEENCSIEEILELLHENNAQVLLVKKNDTLVGLVSPRSLLKFVSARLGKHLLA